MLYFDVDMPDKMFDSFALGRGDPPPPLTVVDEEAEAPLGMPDPPDLQQKEAAAQERAWEQSLPRRRLELPRVQPHPEEEVSPRQVQESERDAR